MTKTLDEIERLVSKIAREAYEESSIKFNDKVDALRVLAPYYAALRKAHGAPVEDSDSTMSDFAKIIHANGEEEPENVGPGPQVRGDRRQ